MAIEINNNLHLKLAKSLDERLGSVDDVASLPVIATASNFLFEGAIIYVREGTTNYQIQDILGTLTWVNIGGTVTTVLVDGDISILNTTTNLDLSSVVPPIANCKSVTVSVVGGTSANLISISNMPDDMKILFLSSEGDTITYTHTDFAGAGIGSIVLENGFNISIAGRPEGNDSITLVKDTNSIVQYGATQFINKGDLSQSLLDALAVNNTLTSTNSSVALSAFMGKTLKDLVDTKQDKIIAGEHISIATDGKTVSSLPWLWEKYTPSTKSFPSLTGIYTTPTQTYRTVDFRGYNEGFWMLPPTKDPGHLPNWFNLDKATPSSTTARYTIAQDLAPTLVNSNYNPKVLLNSLVGTIDGIVFNTDGSSNEKMAFSLESGSYKIKMKLQLTSNKLGDLTLNMYVTNGKSTQALGVPVTNYIMDQVDIPTSLSTTIDGSYTVESYIEVGAAVGTQDGLVFGLTTASDLTTTTIHTGFAGYLEITKIV